MISEYINTFSQMMKDYPWMVGLYSLYGMAVVTYLFRFIPGVWEFVKSQSLTTIELNNAGYSGNSAHFLAFMDWYLKSPYAKWSRYLSLDGKFYDRWGEDFDDKPALSKTYVIGAGYGTHFFFYKKRLFWFTKGALQSSGSEKEKQNIIIKTLGRNQKPLIDLVADFAVKPKETELNIYAFKEEWDVISSVNKRPLASVVLRKDIKDDIVSNLTYFYNNKEWFVKRGLSYKQTYVLHGLPGTGKSSTIKALASNFNKNICLIDITAMGNAAFEKAMASVPKNSIVLIEDFDSCKALHSRDVNSDGTNGMAELMEVLSLSKVLNVLDGVVSLDDTVVFLTTNHLDKIDDALIRKGRVDYIFEIPYLEDTEIKEYIALMYPDAEIPNKTFDTIAGCDLQSIFLDYKEDFNGFVGALTEK
jgi:hypothetical protein